MASPPTLQVETIAGAEAFRRLETEWNTLHDRSARPSFFLTWEWQYSWWESYRVLGPAKELRILVARGPEGEARAILPLYLEERRRPFPSLRLLRLIGSRHESSEYLDLIAPPDLPPESLSPLWESLAAGGADGLLLSDLREDSLLHERLRPWAGSKGLLTRRRAGNTCPYLPLEDDFQAFLGKLSRNLRQNLGRRTRGLWKTGDVVFRKVEEEREAAEAVRTLFTLHRRRWSTRKSRSGFDDEARERFHERLAPRALRAGLLRLYLLEVGGVAAAALYCFRHGGKVYYYQAGMDPAREKQSVGLVLMGKAIEASIAEGSREFDFLRGLEPYKLHWTGLTRETSLLEVAFSPRAALAFWTRSHLLGGLEKVKRTLRSLCRAGNGRG